MEFRDNVKVDLLIYDTSGSTGAVKSPYLDMLGVRRANFLIAGRGALPTTANSTSAQKLTIALYQATDSTGGGATGITSATAVIGKTTVANVIGSGDRANEIYVQFTTLASGATFSVNGLQWSYDSTADATARVMNSTGATGAASVASELFVANFNSTVNNAYATVWVASTISSALVKIGLINPENNTWLTATGSTLVNMGIGKCCADIEIDQTDLKAGFRYVAVQVTGSDTASPYSVMALREYFDSLSTGKTIQARIIPNESTSR